MDLGPEHDGREDEEEETLEAEEDEEDDGSWWRKVTALWREEATAAVRSYGCRIPITDQRGLILNACLFSSYQECPPQQVSMSSVHISTSQVYSLVQSWSKQNTKWKAAMMSAWKDISAMYIWQERSDKRQN